MVLPTAFEHVQLFCMFCLCACDEGTWPWVDTDRFLHDWVICLPDEHSAIVAVDAGELDLASIV